MKKKILIGLGSLAIIFGAAMNITLSSKNELSAISLANIEALSQGDTPGDSYEIRGVLIIVVTNNRDAPSSCKTTKKILISGSIEDGSAKFEYQDVQGMENLCKYMKDSVCKSFSCYSNS